MTSQFVDAAGRVIAVTDPSGRRTRFEYDALNQVMKAVDPLGGETTFTYDANGNLLTLTDALTHTTTWTYNSMDRVATRTDPLNRQERFSYDAGGNLASWTDRKTQVTTFGYDALDRLTFTGYGASGTPPTYASTISRTYDAGDRLTQIVDSTGGTIARGYDLLDRLTSETTPEGSIAYTYDAAGRRATMTVVGQPAVSYTYDNANRLTGITQSTSNVAFSYDAANRRASVTLPNGIVMAYGYDAASQLTGITYTLGTTTIGTLTYTYDLAGSRTAIGGSWARTNLPAALASASYDAANQIVQFGGVSFSYDANGNLTSDGTRTYTWNARNQLVALAGPVAASFTYDGFGRRRAKTVGGVATAFLYDGLNPVQELAGGLPSANLLTGLGIDEYLTRTDAAGARSFLTDALGSTLALADSAGAAQTAYTYEPFGAMTTTGSATSNSHAFTGRETDTSDLLYFRNRYYSSQFQRFHSEDPFRLRFDVNAFSYVRESPTNAIDPLGLFTVIAGGGFSAAFNFGIEGSAGLALNPGWGGCAGVGAFASGGAVAGANIGADAFVGFVRGGFDGVSGSTLNVNITFGPVSVTGFFEPGSGRFMGGTFGAGPSLLPIQGSGSYSYTAAGGYAPRCGDRDPDDPPTPDGDRDGRPGGNPGGKPGGRRMGGRK